MLRELFRGRNERPNDGESLAFSAETVTSLTPKDLAEYDALYLMYQYGTSAHEAMIAGHANQSEMPLNGNQF
jgi:hypothetical protein